MGIGAVNRVEREQRGEEVVCWLFFLPALLWLLGLTLLIAKSATELKYVLGRCRKRGFFEAFWIGKAKAKCS